MDNKPLYYKRQVGLNKKDIIASTTPETALQSLPRNKSEYAGISNKSVPLVPSTETGCEWGEIQYIDKYITSAKAHNLHYQENGFQGVWWTIYPSMLLNVGTQEQLDVGQLDTSKYLTLREARYTVLKIILVNDLASVLEAITNGTIPLKFITQFMNSDIGFGEVDRDRPKNELVHYSKKRIDRFNHAQHAAETILILNHFLLKKAISDSEKTSALKPIVRNGRSPAEQLEADRRLEKVGKDQEWTPVNHIARNVNTSPDKSESKSVDTDQSNISAKKDKLHVDANQLREMAGIKVDIENLDPEALASVVDKIENRTRVDVEDTFSDVNIKLTKHLDGKIELTGLNVNSAIEILNKV